jgi:hypothetical protein
VERKTGPAENEGLACASVFSATQSKFSIQNEGFLWRGARKSGYPCQAKTQKLNLACSCTVLLPNALPATPKSEFGVTVPLGATEPRFASID